MNDFKQFYESLFINEINGEKYLSDFGEYMTVNFAKNYKKILRYYEKKYKEKKKWRKKLD